MPMYDFKCEVCGAPKRTWRPNGQLPRFCSRAHADIWRAGKAFKPTKWPITLEIHAAIEKIYKRDTGNGQVAALAQRLGYPRWKLSRYAIRQGWIAKQKKEPDWTEKEIWTLMTYAHLSGERIQIRLKKAGFGRSVTGIVLKRKRLELLSRLEGWSANSLAALLGVDAHSITKSIKAGKLRAKKRGTHRTKQQGGDSYFIRDSDVREYVMNNLHEIDIRKVDKYWFVELLTGMGD